MSQPERVFFAGETLEQAVMSAARHYEIDPDEMIYERVEKRHGFIKTRRRVVIKVDPHNYRRKGMPSGNLLAAADTQPPSRREVDGNVDRNVSGNVAPRPASQERRHGSRDSRRGHRRSHGRPRREGASELDELMPLREVPGPLAERYPPAEGEVSEVASAWLERLLALAALDVSAAVLQGEDRLEIELSGPDEQLLMEDEGQVLLSLQHLLPRVMQPTLGEIVPCRVDCGNFQEIREEQLRTLAQRVAEEVRERRRPRTLKPMNPADRRIVHLALADDPAVTTESQGDGYFKRVTVRTA